MTPAGTYYGDAVFGKSPWLDSTMGITDYGHRGVPNLFLAAQLSSKGVWNAAHFKNPTYDGLLKDYVAALDLQSAAGGGGEDPGPAARRDAEPLHLLLLLPHGDEEERRNVEVSAMGHYDITKAGFTAAA